MKQHHYQELKQSAIAHDVIELNFHSAEGYKAFSKFVNQCHPKDQRLGRQTCDSQTNNRYNHLYEGYWYANSWCPLTNTRELKQIKPDYPLLQLVTTKGTEKYNQPIPLTHRPDKRHFPRERGYLLGTRSNIITLAKSLNIAHKLPLDEHEQLHLTAISAMSPLEKYQWCLKNGIFDLFAFDSIKYETPSGNGTPFLYLDIPLRILENIAQKYNLTLPEDYQTWDIGDKWRWIKNNPTIPLFITEGIKKAASLISHGQIAIASFSITTHSEKIPPALLGKGGVLRTGGWQTNLKPELLWLLEKNSGRLIYIVFDAADIKESSRKAVQRETKKLGKKLQKYGTVKILTWQDESCKGIDDFLFKHGQSGLNKLIENAIDFQKLWQKQIANSGRKITANLQINQRYFSSQLINQARLNGVKLLCIKSPQNTGKSFSYAQSLQEYSTIKNQQNISYQIGEKVKIKLASELFNSTILGYNHQTKTYQCQLNNGFIERDVTQIISKNKPKALPEKLITFGLTHRQSLSWNLANRFNIDCYLSNIITLISNGIMVCADSSLMIPEHKQFTDMVIDESEQVAWHLLASLTDIRKQRISKIERIIYHGKQIINNNGMITIMDADLSDIGVEFYQHLFGISPEDTLIIENTYQPFKDIRTCLMYADIESLRFQIIESITTGKRIIIHTCGQKENSTHGTINIEKEILQLFPELESKIYRIDKESLGDSNHLSYQILCNLERLKNAQIIIASSSVNTGVSLEENIIGTIDEVFGIFYGNYPLTDFEQTLERWRGDCIRHVYMKNASSERINIGSYKYSDLLANITGQTNNISKLLQSDFDCDLAMDLVKFYCKFAARINNDYQHLKDNFISHLEDKGYNFAQGQKIDKNTKFSLKDFYQAIRDESETNFQVQVDNLEIPDDKRLEELQKSKTKTKSENLEEYKGKLAKRYKTRNITRELIALDRENFYPQLLLRFWLIFGEDEAIKRDKRVLSKYAEGNDNNGYALDFNRQSKSTQSFLLNYIGIKESLTEIGNFQINEIIALLLSMQFNPMWFKCVNIRRLEGLISEFDIMPYLAFKEIDFLKPTFKQVLQIDLDKQHSGIVLLRMILERMGYGVDYIGRYGSRDNRQRYYKMISHVSDELWNELYSNWESHEKCENEAFDLNNRAA